MGSTHSKISSLPFESHILMSSWVTHVEKASYKFKQQFPHCLHLKALGGISE
jgi:hypothetical protein